MESVGLSVNSFFSYFSCFFSFHSDFSSSVRSSSLSLKISIASFPTEHINLVRSASSCGSVIEEKSQVVASCQILAASSGIVSPGFLFMPCQNLYLSLMMNVLILCHHVVVNFIHRQFADLLLSQLV